MNENRRAGSFVIRIVMGILAVVWFFGGLILGPLTVRAITWDRCRHRPARVVGACRLLAQARP
jgi:hypothetical protein